MKNDFKNLTFKELIEKKENLALELMELKFKSVTKQLESPILKRTIKRQIARINTRLYELELKEIENEEKGNE